MLKAAGVALNEAGYAIAGESGSDQCARRVRCGRCARKTAAPSDNCRFRRGKCGYGRVRILEPRLVWPLPSSFDMLNSDSPRPCRSRRADFFESSLEEARIDRLQIDRLRVGWLRTGWPTFGERRSIKGRVGNCGRVFRVAPCVLHRIELLFQWYSHWCAKKNAIGYLPSDAYAVASRRPLPCSPAWIIRPYAGRYHYLLVLLSDAGTIACAA